MRAIDRFDLYMKHKGLNDNKVTNQLKLSNGTIGKSRKDGRDLSDRVIEIIEKFYLDLNPEWLRTGAGEMRRSRSREAELGELIRSRLIDSPESFQSALVTTLLRFDPDGPEMQVLEKILHGLVEDWKSEKDPKTEKDPEA